MRIKNYSFVIQAWIRRKYSQSEYGEKKYEVIACRYDEWIEIDRVICRQNQSEIRSHRTSIEDNPSNEPDNGSRDSPHLIQQHLSI